MSEKETSYRQIMKATSVFGGVQFFNIIISIIRSKFIAVLLGPAGMGVAGLLNSTVQLIGGFTNLGLGASAIKNVSAAHASEDKHKIGTVVSVLRRLVWITGIGGTLLVLFFSELLSQLTFGNKNYTAAFAFISVSLLLTQLSTGQLVVLQGMRKIKYLAQANLLGMLSGLLISVPVYYIWGLDGIVPGIILSPIITLLFSWFFASKVEIEKVKVTNSLLRTEGRDMLKMGIMLSMSSFITLGASYIVRIYIGREGGLDKVGLYNAGFAIINTYVGMIFTAMATDYYPRLSGVSANNQESRNVINQQAEIAILIIAPVLACFLTFISWAVILLYSNKFVEVNGMIQLAALGMFFKTVSWTIGFLFLAKGSTKIYFWGELIANIYFLILNLVGFKYFGLDGLGISFILGYVLYLVQVYIIAKTKYEFKFEKALYNIFIVQFILGILCFISVKMILAPWSYFVGGVLIVLSSIYSYRELDKRIGLKIIFKNIFLRFKK